MKRCKSKAAVTRIKSAYSRIIKKTVFLLCRAGAAAKAICIRLYSYTRGAAKAAGRVLRKWTLHGTTLLRSAYTRARPRAGADTDTVTQSINPRSHPRSKGDSGGRALNFQMLRSTTKHIRHTIARSADGKGTLIAKCTLSAISVLLGFAVLLVFVYGIIPSVISQAAHSFEHDTASELYKRTLRETSAAAFRHQPAVQDITFPRDCFASVLKENPDIVGRLSIDALGLGYLVTQTTDNEYYITMDYKRKASSNGAIYLDYRCNAKLIPPYGHYILYGNAVQGGTMFGHLWFFRDEAFFLNARLMRFDTLYADYQWEVFSVYVAEPDFDFSKTVFASDDDWLAYLRALEDKSLYKTDVQLSADDVLLTLCTEADDFPGARLAVHARLYQ